LPFNWWLVVICSFCLWRRTYPKLASPLLHLEGQWPVQRVQEGAHVRHGPHWSSQQFHRYNFTIVNTTVNKRSLKTSRLVIRDLSDIFWLRIFSFYNLGLPNRWWLHFLDCKFEPTPVRKESLKDYMLKRLKKCHHFGAETLADFKFKHVKLKCLRSLSFETKHKTKIVLFG